MHHINKFFWLIISWRCARPVPKSATVNHWQVRSSRFTYSSQRKFALKDRILPVRGSQFANYQRPCATMFHEIGLNPETCNVSRILRCDWSVYCTWWWRKRAKMADAWMDCTRWFLCMNSIPVCVIWVMRSIKIKGTHEH